jgi:hypothetical protein
MFPMLLLIEHEEIQKEMKHQQINCQHILILHKFTLFFSLCAEAFFYRFFCNQVRRRISKLELMVWGFGERGFWRLFLIQNGLPVSKI